jgi:hypothetical protein
VLEPGITVADVPLCAAAGIGVLGFFQHICGKWLGNDGGKGHCCSIKKCY